MIKIISGYNLIYGLKKKLRKWLKLFVDTLKMWKNIFQLSFSISSECHKVKEWEEKIPFLSAGVTAHMNNKLDAKKNCT